MLTLSRRRFARRTAAWLGYSMVGGPMMVASVAAAKDKVGATLQATKWMDAWLTRHRAAAESPGGMLYVGRFKDPIYFLTKPIAWIPDGPQKGRYASVDVPSGFVTDFASIPRAFWSLLRPDGEYTYPAIIHDFMYWQQGRPREEADEILRFGMRDFGVSAVKIAAIYAGVRSPFGQSAWNENARLKRTGEKRILKTPFPTDPRTTWEQWKSKSEAFADGL